VGEPPRASTGTLACASRGEHIGEHIGVPTRLEPSRLPADGYRRLDSSEAPTMDAFKVCYFRRAPLSLTVLLASATAFDMMTYDMGRGAVMAKGQM
jgi:hypothetical protein